MSSPKSAARSEEHTSELQSLRHLVCRLLLEKKNRDRKSTRLNSSHLGISYAVSCLKKIYGMSLNRGTRYSDSRPLSIFPPAKRILDRKSTRLNSSHLGISYAVFCLKKKKNT